jgi:hypothetical protein
MNRIGCSEASPWLTTVADAVQSITVQGHGPRSVFLSFSAVHFCVACPLTRENTQCNASESVKHQRPEYKRADQLNIPFLKVWISCGFPIRLID